MRCRVEFDEFFGVWNLIPYLMISEPTPQVEAESDWNVSIGWLRWGWTLTIWPRKRKLNAPPF